MDFISLTGSLRELWIRRGNYHRESKETITPGKLVFVKSSISGYD